MRKWQNIPYSVYHFCVLHYRQKQKYSTKGYILGSKQHIFIINMTSIKEHVQIDDPLLKGLTSLYYTPQLQALYLSALLFSLPL